MLHSQMKAYGSSTSLSGSTYEADSEEEFNAQLAEEGLAPDSEAQLTASLLGALHHPAMTIGAAFGCSRLQSPANYAQRKVDRICLPAPATLWHV